MKQSKTSSGYCKVQPTYTELDNSQFLVNESNSMSILNNITIQNVEESRISEKPETENVTSLLPVPYFNNDSIIKPLNLISPLKSEKDHVQTGPKTRFTLDELLDLDLSLSEDLFEDFIPVGAISMLAGRGGVGKSMFYLQLSLTISHGLKEFLGKKITTRYDSILIIATEDSDKILSIRSNKQFKKLAPGVPRSKKMIVHTTGENLFDTLRFELEQERFDLVVLDALSDILKDDLNSPIATRSFCNELEKLIREFETTFLLIHHENKSQNKNGRDRILGSTAIVDRCRSVLILSKDNKTGMRTLNIEKANNISDEKISKPIKLRFDSETFTFSKAGDYDVTKEIDAETSKAAELSKKQQFSIETSDTENSKSSNNKPGRKRDEMKFEAAHRMHSEGIPQVEISKILNVNKATVCRWLKETDSNL